MDLRDVLCVKEKRHVGNDACVSWRGRTLQLLDARAGLRRVEVWEQADGSLAIIDGGRRQKWLDAGGHGTMQSKPRRVIKNNKRYKPQPHQQFRLDLKAPPRKPSPPRRLQMAG